MIRSFLNAAMRALETPAGRRLFWIAVCAVFAGVGINAVVRAEFPEKKFVPRLHYTSPSQIAEDKDSQAKWRSSEFRGFRALAWGSVMENLDPYEDINLKSNGKPHVRAYPPFFGIAFFPFAVPWQIPGAGSALFFLTSFAFALAAAWACAAWANENPRFGVFALTFILLAPLALDVMVRCESDMLVLFPVAAAFFWLVRGEKKFRAGALLGFAAAFKVLPGLFGVYLLFTRQWRALAGMILAGIVCTVVLPVLVWGPARAWKLHVSWYERVVVPYHTGKVTEFIGSAYRPSNQSLTAGLNRLLWRVPVEKGEHNINLLSLPPRTVSLLIKCLQLIVAVGLVVLWALCGRGRDAKSAAVLMALAAPGIMLLSDVSLTSHHVLLILPVAAILVRMLVVDDGEAGRWSWVFAVYLLALVALAIAGVKSFAVVKSYTPLLPVTVVLLAACAVVALRDRQAQPALARAP